MKPRMPKKLPPLPPSPKAPEERFADAFERVALCQERSLEIQSATFKAMLEMIAAMKKRGML